MKTNDDSLNSIPPKHILQFGPYKIDPNYREALFKAYPRYTIEEIIGSFIGYNPNFPSQEDWLNDEEDEDLGVPIFD